MLSVQIGHSGQIVATGCTDFLVRLRENRRGTAECQADIKICSNVKLIGFSHKEYHSEVSKVELQVAWMINDNISWLVSIIKAA